jgi:hypothetical protein
MPLYGKPIGAEEKYIPLSQREQEEPAWFLLLVLSQRDMVTLKNLEGGWIDPEANAFKTRGGSVTDYACTVGLGGWGNVRYSQHDPLVKQGQVQAGDEIPFRFKGSGQRREVHRDTLERIPWEIQEELALEIRRRNDVSEDEGNLLGSARLSLSTTGDTIADGVPSATATKQGQPDDQDDQDTP